MKITCPVELTEWPTPKSFALHFRQRHREMTPYKPVVAVIRDATNEPVAVARRYANGATVWRFIRSRSTVANPLTARFPRV
jgi:hypothetical protein